MRDGRVGTKGFTLIELIVVLAVLAILAAIIIPRYSEVQYASKIKADATTAGGIIGAARVQEISTSKVLSNISALSDTYYEGINLIPQSGNGVDIFVLSKLKDEDKYVVRWTAEADKVGGDYAGEYSLTEGDGLPEGKYYKD